MAIDIGTEFYPRLANRNRAQGDGKNTAVEFRKKYLQMLDNPEIWKTSDQPLKVVALDFKNVKKIGPSFANEAFAYFTQYASPDEFLRAVDLKNISKVQLMIIKEELDSGYYGR